MDPSDVPHDGPSDELPTPDELLLELMDLVQLAFPAALTSMSITFVKNEDGQRPALADLDGQAAPGAPERPELGHADDRVLDAINAILLDIADATDRQGGVRVLAGRLVIEGGPDGDRFAKLLDAALDESHGPVMTRRFDASELRWLFFTRELFAALNDTEARELDAKRTIDAELRAYQKFAIDMARGTITFAGASERPERTFRFELLGSHLEETQRFLWGWANESAPAPFTRRVDALRAASTGPGLRAFTEGAFGCPERCAERLARHAAVAFPSSDGCQGVYRAGFKGRSPEGKTTSGFMYLALFEA